MPRRSVTCSKALDELVANTRELRLANILDDIDKQLSGCKKVVDNSILREASPIPEFMFAHAHINDHMDVDVKPVIVDHHHASDSGIGSSVSDSKSGMQTPWSLNSSKHPLTNTYKERRSAWHSSSRCSVRSSHSTLTSVTRSGISFGVASDNQHCLSEGAVKRIRATIVEPILKEKSLQEFHPLIRDIPHRIGAKAITNLRDLEKTILFLAPVSAIIHAFDDSVAHTCGNVKEFANSPKSYLRFCQRSIRLIVNTVDLLTERDQRLPTDRPYTNGYFLDLVEQIRRYAHIMARTRAREAAGEATDDMDFSSYDSTIPFHCTQLTHYSTDPRSLFSKTA